MSRARKKIGLSQESAIDLMQEIYVEIVDERNKALQSFKKFTRDIEENEDIAMVGKIANDLLKIVDSSIEKKIRLLKIQTDILYKGMKAGDNSKEDFKLSEEDSARIHEEIKRSLQTIDKEEDNEIKYD